MKIFRFALPIALAFSVLGCAKAPDSKTVTDAVAEAMNAVTSLAKTTPGALPMGYPLATNFDGGRQFVIAKKVGNVPNRLDCAFFDVMVSRPTSQFTFFGKGDSDYQPNVKVCATGSAVVVPSPSN